MRSSSGADPQEPILTRICSCAPQLFLEVGNKNANGFWAANLPLEEEVHCGASVEQRATFIRRKYRERKYCGVLEDRLDPEELNKVQLSSYSPH